MSKIEIDLQKLSILEQEIQIMEGRKRTLESEIATLNRECNTKKDITNKEIAQQKQACDAECQELINKANQALKDAEDKLKTVIARERDSLVIEGQIKRLDESKEAFESERKAVESIRISALEREKKAELIIEQYTKKLLEMGVKPEEPKPESKKSKTEDKTKDNK